MNKRKTLIAAFYGGGTLTLAVLIIAISVLSAGGLGEAKKIITTTFSKVSGSEDSTSSGSTDHKPEKNGGGNNSGNNSGNADSTSSPASGGENFTMKMKTLEFTDNGEILQNPLMGWQYYAFPREILTEGIPDGFDIAVILTSWDVLEPEPDVYDFTLLDRCVRKLKAAGKTVYFRLYCMPDDVWNIDGTPGWLWDEKNVPYEEVEDKLFAGGGQATYTARHPLYWDKGYQNELSKFLKTIAGHYKDGEVDIIDMRCYNLYGEWDAGWCMFPWEKFSPDPWNFKRETLNQIVDIYGEAFGGYERTKVACNISAADLVEMAKERGVAEITKEEYQKEAAFDNSLSRGFAIRYDGVGPGYNPELFSSWMINESFPKCPIFSETFYGYDSGTYSIKNTIKTFLKYRVNGATFGFFKGNYKKIFTEYPEDFKETRKQMGYRLLPAKLTYSETVESGGTFRLDGKWENLGVGVCYNRYPLTVEFHDKKGNIVYKETDFEFDQSSWVNEYIYNTSSVFKLPGVKNLPKGTYSAYISLSGTDLKPAIALPIGENGRTARKYLIGEVKVH